VSSIPDIVDAAIPDDRDAPGIRRSVFRCAAEFADDPTLLEPPAAVVPRIAYKGRLTVLAGPDKVGKSTFVGYAQAAITRGASFLSDRGELDSYKVLHVGLEEPIADPIQRWTRAGADLAGIDILQFAERTLFLDIRERVQEGVDLVVIDSLTAYAATMGEVPGDGDNAGWAAVVRPLASMAHDDGVAVLVLHHVRKSDETYRGPTEIAAAVDLLAEMTEPKSAADPTERRIKGRARFAWSPFSTVFRGNSYEIAGGGEVSIDALVLSYVQQHPGCSRSALYEAIGKRRQRVMAAVNRLLAANQLVEEVGDRGHMVLNVRGLELGLEAA
jgi:hypothetical protein